LPTGSRHRWPGYAAGRALPPRVVRRAPSGDHRLRTTSRAAPSGDPPARTLGARAACAATARPAPASPDDPASAAGASGMDPDGLAAGDVSRAALSPGAGPAARGRPPPRIASTLLRPMPARIATPPASCTGPSGLAKSTVPAMAPTSGSRFRKAPATSADTRVCANVNNVVGPTVPATISAAVASTTPGRAGPPCRPPVTSITGSVTTAAAMSCRPVTATGSRSRSSRACDTVKAAEASCPASTRPSPPRLAPSPLPTAMTATPASDMAKPTHAAGRATLCPQTAASSAISTGVAPISRAA
jgi:hypothetical protein